LLILLGDFLVNWDMTLKEFVMHKTRWLNGWSEHMKLGNIDFKTYMRMRGMSEEEFDILDKQSKE